MSKANLKPGSTIYSVATGNVRITRRSSREAAKYVASLNGFVGVTPYYPAGTLWYFDTLNAAKRARNMMLDKGINCGDNICEFRVADDGVPEMVGGIK